MPLYDFKCSDCTTTREKLISWEKAKEGLTCTCGGHMTKQVSMPAKTPGAWNSGWTDGLSGYAQYDNGLGMNIYSEKHRDRELEKRGWIRESDLGGDDWWERETSKRKEQVKKDQENADRYQANLKKFDGDKAKALTETYPAKECLAGTFDRID